VIEDFKQEYGNSEYVAVLHDDESGKEFLEANSHEGAATAAAATRLVRFPPPVLPFNKTDLMLPA